eukprot:scaffold4659_cov125-Isochrysis_galbana.AAC.15
MSCLAYRHSCGCQCSTGFWAAAGPEPMSSFDCWCLAPESTLRHLWTSQNLRRRSVVGSGRGVRCACGGDACAYRLVGCWGAARPLGEGHLVIWLFSIVDMTSVNGAAFRQLRVACETHTGVISTAAEGPAGEVGWAAAEGWRCRKGKTSVAEGCR